MHVHAIGQRIHAFYRGIVYLIMDHALSLCPARFTVKYLVSKTALAAFTPLKIRLILAVPES